VVLYLETLGRIDAVVLDKTGTLTFGQAQVREIIPAKRVLEVEVLEGRGVGGDALRASSDGPS